MFKVIFFFFIFSCVILSFQPQRKPWAYKWSQSFIYHSPQNVTSSGTFWYDWQKQSMRVDFDNSMAMQECKMYSPQKTSCTYLMSNGLIFFAFSEKRLCLFAGYDNPPPPDQQIMSSKFITNRIINGKNYYEWKDTSEYNRIYITTADQKQIYFRDDQVQDGKTYTILNYFVDSYTQTFNSKIFDYPNYCIPHLLPTNSQSKQNIMKKVYQMLRLKKINQIQA